MMNSQDLQIRKVLIETQQWTYLIGNGVPVFLILNFFGELRDYEAEKITLKRLNFISILMVLAIIAAASFTVYYGLDLYEDAQSAL